MFAIVGLFHVTTMDKSKMSATVAKSKYIEGNLPCSLFIKYYTLYVCLKHYKIKMKRPVPNWHWPFHACMHVNAIILLQETNSYCHNFS